MLTRLNLLACILAVAEPGLAEIQTRDMPYHDGKTPLKGYYAYDDSIEGPRPGVLVVHEWWGQNEHARKQAERLAAEGYAALALDMYGKGKVAEHPEDAGAMAGEIRKNAPLALRRFHASLGLLKRQAEVDPERIAAIGYCFGGGIVLDMARVGHDLDAVVSFHGSLPTSQPNVTPKDIKTRILVCHGAEDSFTTPEQIEAFKEEMTGAGATFEILVLEGAKHSFTNPKADDLGMDGIGYDADADRDSFAAMLKLFSEVFSSETGAVPDPAPATATGE